MRFSFLVSVTCHVLKMIYCSYKTEYIFAMHQDNEELKLVDKTRHLETE